MKTNKPEMKIYEPSEKGATTMRKVSFRNTGPDRYVRLSDYEALQSELETVKKVAYGNIELLERNEALQAECEKLRKDAERYRWLRDAEELPMNLMRLEMIGDVMDSAIDEAMQESKPCSLSS